MTPLPFSVTQYIICSWEKWGFKALFILWDHVPLCWVLRLQVSCQWWGRRGSLPNTLPKLWLLSAAGEPPRHVPGPGEIQGDMLSSTRSRALTGGKETAELPHWQHPASLASPGNVCVLICLTGDTGFCFILEMCRIPLRWGWDSLSYLLSLLLNQPSQCYLLIRWLRELHVCSSFQTQLDKTKGWKMNPE